MACTASLQTAADHLLDDPNPSALLTLKLLPTHSSLDDFPLRPASIFVKRALSQSFRIVFFDPLEVLLLGLVESSSDFLLQNAFSLAGTAGELILLMEGCDVRVHLGTDEVGHVRSGMEFVTVGTGNATRLVGPLAFLTILASLLVGVGDVAIVPHQSVSNAYISMHPASINHYQMKHTYKQGGLL